MLRITFDISVTVLPRSCGSSSENENRSQQKGMCSQHGVGGPRHSSHAAQRRKWQQHIAAQPGRHRQGTLRTKTTPLFCQMSKIGAKVLEHVLPVHQFRGQVTQGSRSPGFATGVVCSDSARRGASPSVANPVAFRSSSLNNDRVAMQLFVMLEFDDIAIFHWWHQRKFVLQFVSLHQKQQGVSDQLRRRGPFGVALSSSSKSLSFACDKVNSCSDRAAVDFAAVGMSRFARAVPSSRTPFGLPSKT